MDMLALMLSLANVGANAEVLVLDMLGGLLTASVAERLGGNVVSLVDFVRLLMIQKNKKNRLSTNGCSVLQELILGQFFVLEVFMELKAEVQFVWIPPSIEYLEMG